MVDAFAAYSDLESRLNRTFTTAERTWITALLGDASTYLRNLVSQQIYPQSVVTYTDYPQQGRVDLPQYPVVSVTSVQRDGVDVYYKYRPGYLFCIGSDDPVDITYTYGFATVPDLCVSMACVLVSSALLTLEAGIGLTAGGLSSAALDDFKVAWADAGASSGMVLPEAQEEMFCRQFGRGSTSVVGPYL